MCGGRQLRGQVLMDAPDDTDAGRWGHGSASNEGQWGVWGGSEADKGIGLSVPGIPGGIAGAGQDGRWIYCRGSVHSGPPETSIEALLILTSRVTHPRLAPGGMGWAEHLGEPWSRSMRNEGCVGRHSTHPWTFACRMSPFPCNPLTVEDVPRAVGISDRSVWDVDVGIWGDASGCSESVFGPLELRVGL